MRQFRRAADALPSGPRSGRSAGRTTIASAAIGQVGKRKATPARYKTGRPDAQRDAWRWAQANRAEDGSLPSGREIGTRHGHHERWGRMVKRSGLAGEFGS
jgi:hypothetical protein